MIRSGRYCKYQEKVFMCGFKDSVVLLRSNDYEDVLLRGFINNQYYGRKPLDWQTKYRKDVPIEDVEWFCSIGNIGYYRGYKVGIVKETDTEYVITSGFVSANHEVFTKENGFEEIDRYLFEGKVPKSEVTDVKEVKRPISDKYKAPDNWDF